MKHSFTFSALSLLFSVAPAAQVLRGLVLPRDARSVLATSVGPRVPPSFNINCGGDSVGRFIAEDHEWLVGLTSTFSVDNATIGGAERQNAPIYPSHRFGTLQSTWGYNIPVEQPGVYGCTAHFAETFSEAFRKGDRVFDLSFSTTHDFVLFKNIDVIGELKGAEFTVLTKTAVGLNITGILAVRLYSRHGDAMLSGLTCERTGNLPGDITSDYSVPEVAKRPSVDGVYEGGLTAKMVRARKYLAPISTITLLFFFVGRMLLL